MISYDFKGNFSNLTAGLTAAGASVRTLGTNLTALDANGARARKGLSTLGSAAGKIGLVAAAGFGVMVAASANFDAAMSKVQAATHETAGNMDALREAAIKAGADTAFSASEAAAGIENLAKAGISTADILGGGLDGALSLAAAGSLGVADAAEIAATALTQFKLTGADVPHVADLLSAGAGKAQGSVQDLGEALKYVGVPANALGVSIEETTGTLALFASNGILGSQAGTQLRSVLGSLAAPTKFATEEMSKYGIEMYDSQGKFIGVSAAAEELKTKLGGATDAERNHALSVIFGKEAMQGSIALYDGGAKAVEGWTSKVDDSGYAAETAALNMDNLKGDLEQLGGSLETFLIGAGDGAQGPLRQLTQGATAAVNAFAALPKPIQSAASGLLALTAVTGGALWFGAKVIGGIAATKLAIAELGLTARISAISMAGIGKAALRLAAPMAGFAVLNSDAAKSTGLSKTAGLGLIGLMAGPWGAALGVTAGLTMDMAAANNDLEDAIKKAGQAIATTDFSAQNASMAAAIEQLDKFRAKTAIVSKESLGPIERFGAGLAGGKNMVEGWFGDSDVEEAEAKIRRLEAVMQTGQAAAGALGEAMGMTIGPIDGTARSAAELDAVVSKATPAMEKLGITFDDLTTAQGVTNAREMGGAVEGILTGIGMLSASDQGIGSLNREIASTAVQMDSVAGKTENVSAAMTGVSATADGAADSVKALSDSLDALFGPALGLERATNAYKMGILELSGALKENGATLNQNSKAGIANRNEVADRVESIKDLVVAQKNSGKSAGVMAKTFAQGREAILKSGKAADISRKAMAKLINTLNLTPKFIKTQIQAANAAKTAQQIKTLQDGYSRLPDDVRTDIAANGIPKTKAEVDSLVAKYKLTEKQRTALMTLKADAARASAAALARFLDSVARDRTSTIRVTTVRTTVNGSPGRTDIPLPGSSARGNIFAAYAAGGMDRRDAHQPEFAGPGVTRVWREPETGGESYIPHRNDSRRGRAKAITEQTAGLFGGEVTWHAKGSATGYPAGDVPYSAGDILGGLKYRLRESERALTAETKARDKMRTRLDDLNSKAADYRSGVAGNLMSDPFAMGEDVWGAGGGFNPLGTIRGDIRDSKRFRSASRDLRKRGLSGGALLEVDTLEEAQAAQGLSRSELTRLSRLYRQRDRLASKAGGGNASAVFGERIREVRGELQESNRELRDLKQQIKNVQHAIEVKTKRDDKSRKDAADRTGKHVNGAATNGGRRRPGGK